MSNLEQLRRIYADYDREALEARQEARPFDGILGLGNDPRRHPCHKHFYAAVQSWVEEFLQAEPDGETAFQAAEEIILAADRRRNNRDTYWYCYAAQGLAADLLPTLTPERCRELAETYDRLYPKKDRLPVQKALFKQLKKLGK